MSENHEQPVKRRFARIGELGPVWVTAVAGLIVALTTGSGFIVEHFTASSDTRSPVLETKMPAPAVEPSIHIQDPVDGDGINMTPVILRRAQSDQRTTIRLPVSESGKDPASAATASRSARDSDRQG